MRQLYIGFLCAWLLMSCGDSETAGDKEKSDDAARGPKFHGLFALYKEIVFDSLDVYSNDADDPGYQFEGRKLDSTNVALLDAKHANEWQEGYFACYKFKVNDSLTGLLTRVPAEYVSNSVDLYVYNTRADSVVKVINVAASFGDAGDASSRVTRIIRDKDLLFLSLVAVTYDRSVEDEKDTIVEEWNFFELFRFLSQRVDTVSKDSATITDKYKTALQQLERYQGRQ